MVERGEKQIILDSMLLTFTKSKKWPAIVLIFLICGVALDTYSQTTNLIPSNLFLTDNGRIFRYRPSGERVVNIKTIQEAQKSIESRPADQDPEDHWGQSTNGFQLALRFEKAVFTNGESVVATTLMRNVTKQPQTYFKPIKFLVMKDAKTLKRKDDNGMIEINLLPMTTLFPQTQNRDRESLDQMYDLSQAGSYVVQAVSDRPIVTSQMVSIVIKNNTPPK